MSRKDPRRRIMVPLSTQERAWLRDRARGRSLADVLRRVVQDGLGQADLVWEGQRIKQSCSDTGLPLQLPRKTLHAVVQRSEGMRQSPEDLVRALLVHRMQQDDGNS